MARILVTSTLPRDGKSVVASGLAIALRATGVSVRLVRLDDGESAGDDAAQFSRIRGVRSTDTPLAADAIADDADHTVIEGSPDTSISADYTLLVVRHGEADDETVSKAIADLSPDGIIVNGVPEHGQPAARDRITALGGQAIATIPQNRHLAAPTVREITPALEGALSGDEELFDEASRDLVIGPVSAHEGMDYFRKYPDKTVVSRHDRIDIALGALDYEPLCLILSGGEPTLPYVAQRAERESFALITTPLSTVEAVAAIGPLYGAGRFSGQRKLGAAAALVGECVPLELIG